VPAHDTVFFNLRDDIAESMLRGFEAVQLTDRQREEAISDAKAKGIKAKSGGE